MNGAMHSSFVTALVAQAIRRLDAAAGKETKVQAWLVGSVLAPGSALRGWLTSDPFYEQGAAMY